MSVNDATETKVHPVTGQFATLSGDGFAGLIASTISVAYGLSFAVLIFAPPLTPWIADGIAATFLTTAISAAFIAARAARSPSLSRDLTGPPSRSRQRWWRRFSNGSMSTIGEMGLITRQMHSATIQAELDSVLYALSVEAYERLKRENRPPHKALVTYVVTVMAERLSFASKVIGVLRR